MLQQLYIQNYAIIDEISIRFEKGLNIITGETGAGKSILVGALGLILGDRADSQVLMDKEKKCIVEGVFDHLNSVDADKFFQQNELEQGGEIIIRREIGAAGKSRAFINDTPVNLGQLQQLAGLLVDMHQQFETLELGEDLFQLQVLDALANHNTLIEKYKIQFRKFSSLKKQFLELQSQQLKANKELDYYKFLYQEFEELKLEENELEELEAEIRILSNAENIKSVLNKISLELQEGEQPVIPQLKSIGGQLHQLNEFHSEIPALQSRIQSVQIELKDIAGELEHINDRVQVDEKRMIVVNERLTIGYKLLKKHGVKTTAELLSIQKEIEEKLNKVLNIEEDIERLSSQLDIELAQLKKLSDELTANRKKQIPALEKKTNALLSRVGMMNARFKVTIDKKEMSESGADKPEFLFDANKSDRFEPLRKVASGGELSRLMLSIKSLVADSIQLPTLIFDEIDTGISGEAAKQVGLLMKELGSAHQVISITHQPQIAAKADSHYFVFKKETLGKIKTQIRKLSDTERVDAIAKMLGGEKPSAVVVENAREMIG